MTVRQRLRTLEGRVTALESRLGEMPEIPVDDARILLERALEAHGFDLNDPILSGLAALESDLWTLFRSTANDPMAHSRVTETLDRLAQRASLLVHLTRGGAT